MLELARDMLIAIVGGCVGALACEFATVLIVAAILAQVRKEKKRDKKPK